MLSLCEPETFVEFSNPLDFETIAHPGEPSDHKEAAEDDRVDLEYDRYVRKAIRCVPRDDDAHPLAHTLEGGYPSCNGRRMKI